MLKLIRNIIVILLIPCFAYAGGAMGLMMGSGSTTADLCDTLAQSETGASAGNGNIMAGTSGDWYATKFTTGASGYTACTVKVYLEKVLSPTGVLTWYIYDHDGVEDDPNAAVCTVGTINMADVPAAETAITMSGCSCVLSGSTAYWLVSFANQTSASDYIGWHYETTGATEKVVKDGDGSGTWTGVSTTITMKYEIYQ